MVISRHRLGLRIFAKRWKRWATFIKPSTNLVLFSYCLFLEVFLFFSVALPIKKSVRSHEHSYLSSTPGHGHISVCVPCEHNIQDKPQSQCCVPMSSVKPPTGSRQVPVTNWSRRILFSLSISFTTCSSKASSLAGHQHSCVGWITRVCPVHLYLPEPVDLLAVLGVMSVDRVLLPVGHIDLLHPTQHQLWQRKQRNSI